jgi:hypothetical protein
MVYGKKNKVSLYYFGYSSIDIYIEIILFSILCYILKKALLKWDNKQINQPNYILHSCWSSCLCIKPEFKFQNQI